jgi:hypothetical protein
MASGENPVRGNAFHGTAIIVVGWWCRRLAGSTDQIAIVIGRPRNSLALYVAHCGRPKPELSVKAQPSLGNSVASSPRSIASDLEHG